MGDVCRSELYPQSGDLHPGQVGKPCGEASCSPRCPRPCCRATWAIWGGKGPVLRAPAAHPAQWPGPSLSFPSCPGGTTMAVSLGGCGPVARAGPSPPWELSESPGSTHGAPSKGLATIAPSWPGFWKPAPCSCPGPCPATTSGTGWADRADVDELGLCPEALGAWEGPAGEWQVRLPRRGDRGAKKRPSLPMLLVTWRRVG